MMTEHFKELSDSTLIESSPERLKDYIINNPLVKNRNNAKCAIIPRDVPELQRVITIAKNNKVGLVPVSSGTPHAKDGIACPQDHAVIDLSGWKKIPWVNRRNRVCLIEPGVTFNELNTYLKEHGMTVPTPLAPRKNKSILASVIDREPQIWPKAHWDMQDPVASTEFIFGNGELFRSGAAGGPGTLEQQREAKGAQKMPMGPGQTDFQRVIMGAQGSLGIMTWITIRTELLPSIERPMVAATDQISKLIGYTYEVQRPWLGEHFFILNKTAAAMLMMKDGTDNFNSIRDSIPEYICMQNIAGFERLPQERVEYQHEELSDIAGSNGIKLTDSSGEIEAAALLATARWNESETDWRHKLKGHSLNIFFLSLLNKSEKYIDIFRKAMKEHDLDTNTIGIYLQPIVQNHACHMEFMIPYDPGNQKEIETMTKFEHTVTRQLLGEGAFFSRPYGTAAENVFKKNPANTGLIKVAKDIFDPENILNPGKFNL